VSRLSQARRHSWRLSRTTKTGSEFEATATKPSGGTLMAPIALNGAQRRCSRASGQERIGEARKWKEEPLQKPWVHGKLPSLRLGLAFRVHVEQVSCGIKKLFHSAGRRVLQGLANHAVIDAFIGINSFGPFGPHTLRLTSASTLAYFHVRS
jgi:hypothetical protein